MKLFETFKKLADAVGSPQIDPAKAAAMQAGATQSGWQPAAWLSNLKSGLGIGKSPVNTGKSGS